MLMVEQAMLELFARNTGVTSDAIVIQTAFDAGKALHDSIDAMSFEDEVSLKNNAHQLNAVSSRCFVSVGPADFAVTLHFHQRRVIRQRPRTALEFFRGLQALFHSH